MAIPPWDEFIRYVLFNVDQLIPEAEIDADVNDGIMQHVIQTSKLILKRKGSNEFIALKLREFK